MPTCTTKPSLAIAPVKMHFPTGSFKQCLSNLHLLAAANIPGRNLTLAGSLAYEVWVHNFQETTSSSGQDQIVAKSFRCKNFYFLTTITL